MNIEEKYRELTDTFIIPSDVIPYAVYKEGIAFFKYESDILDRLWEKAALNYSKDKTVSKSFNQLYVFLIETIIKFEMVTLKKIKQAYEDYKDSILAAVQASIVEDIKSIQKEINKDELLPSNELAEFLLSQKKIYGGGSKEFFDMLNNLTAQNAFKELEDGSLEAVITDKSGDVVSKASITSELEFIDDKQLNTVWNGLVTTIDKFDELTADLLDLIASMWIVQEKDENGFLTLDSKVVLRILFPDKDIFRERDHFKIMERISILANTFIAKRDEIDEDEANELRKEFDVEDNNANFRVYKRMFYVDDIRVIEKRSLKQPIGIHSLKIKPAPLLINLFNSPNLTFRVMDLKIIQYNSVKQRELKRLGRYLSFQWKIRTSNNNLSQPFKVQTLLERVNISKRYVGSLLVDRFEEVLDQLQQDNIIKSWQYIDLPPEEIRNKKGFVKYVWPNLLVNIEPPDEMVDLNKCKFGVDKNPNLYLNEDVAEKIEVATEILSKTNDVANVKKNDVRDIMNRHNLKLREAAAEIGISAPTLSRYLKDNTIKMRAKNLEKIAEWLETKK